ncbi:type II secretion system protein GspJ [Methylolobus aquaticus]
MRSNGFTLLEVLIATTLLSIMMVLLMGSLRLGARSWDRGEEQIDQTSQMLVVSSFFRRHLTNAIPWRMMEQQRPEPMFSGSRDAIEYIGLLPAQIKSGLYRFRFFVDRRRDRTGLKLSVRSVDTSGEAEPIEDLEVLRDVEEVRFAFLAPRAPGDPPVWVEEWTDEMMPTAISIRVRVRGQEAWPAIVIAPRIEPLA